ncbi:MAG: signal transduction histidine kinase [Gammaproteobacteria bacterium]|jgi:signal transduction histidine kinase
MGIFLASVSILLSFIYWSTAGYMQRQADATIETEIQGLAEQYRHRGLEGLSVIMRERVARNPDGESLYLFASSDYRALAGNLSRWPDAVPDDEGWITFPLWGRAEAGSQREPGHFGRARIFQLQGGLHLLVGRDVYELDEVQTLIANALGWGLALTAALAALGGLVTSWSMSRRIEAINQTSRDIMRGDLSRRVPTRGRDDDFDQLADNLNAMLDRIQDLMASVREVSDNVAHDLKTPLARLRNRLEMLQPSQHAPRTGEEIDELTTGALSEADRLLSMFDAVLRIARIESGARAMHRKPFDLVRVLADACELYEPLAQDEGIVWTTQWPEKIQIEGDRDLLFQALCNVLDNALKYSAAPGHIHVSAHLEERTALVPYEEAVIAISDTGPGIPPEERERVFRRFLRLESARTRPGNGLGLSMVRAAMGLHEGRVQLDENSPQGLLVTLRLPAGGTVPLGAATSTNYRLEGNPSQRL